jgi:mono/diheme cytochrome c family protein
MGRFESFLPHHPFPRASLRVAARAGAMLVAALVSAAAQGVAPAAPSGPLTFTGAQVSHGEGLFADNCAVCHGESLQGIDCPPLVGGAFRVWFDGPVGALFLYVHANMPADRPGTLTAEQAAALVAFIMAQNGFAAGATPLPTDPAELGQMGFAQ